MLKIKRCLFLLLVILFFNLRNLFSQPIADFNPSRYKICSGSIINLNNLSTGSTNFKWLLEGLPYSTAHDTSLVLIENCYDIKSIKLIACDSLSGLCDSITRLVEVFDSCYFHLTGDFLQCPGDTISLNTNPEAISTYWDIQPPHAFINGCDTCAGISFILQHHGTMVDKHLTYEGDCSEVITFHYLCGISTIEVPYFNFGISPNPFSDFLTIENKSNKTVNRILVFNNLGRVIFQSENTKTRLDLSGIPEGVYYLKIYFEDVKLRNNVFKIIKI